MRAPPIAFGPFVLDLDRGRLSRDGHKLCIGNKGLVLLNALLNAREKTLSKAELMDAAWPGLSVEESNLSVQIAALRKLLGPMPGGGEWIVTVPRVGYRMLEESDAATGTQARAGRGLDAPSILVLPFENKSGEREQDYLADGITEDIIIALSRFRWFRVIGRNSSFAYKGSAVPQIYRDFDVRYVLAGALRKSGRRLRISAQLLEAASGNHIWAERYDLEMTDSFAIQDDIAERVAGIVEPELLQTEAVLASTRHTGNITAWDLVRRGTWHFHQVTRETHSRARELFRQSCRIDPHLPEAHLWLARVNAGIVAYSWSINSVEDIREGMEAGIKAVRLDDRNPYCHYGLAIVSVYGNELDQAILAAERAIELSPSFALGHLVLGMARLYIGRTPEAIAALRHGLALNPHDPQNFVWFNVLAVACLLSERPELALETAHKALKIRPTWRLTLEVLAWCHVALGQADAARACVRQLQMHRQPADAIFMPLAMRNPQWAAQMAEKLRSVGWRD